MIKLGLGLLVGVVTIGINNAIAAKPTERPNFLFICTDHYTAQAFSYVGNPNVKTPNLDGLARDGVFFNNAYCAYPLSTPSRASFITGLMPHENSVNRNRLPLPERFEANSLGHLLKDAGYNAAWYGKWHIGKLDEAKHGFEGNSCPDAIIAKSVIDFLKKQNIKGKPFFIAASYSNPHNICEVGRRQPLPDATIDWESIPLKDCPNVRPNFARNAFAPEILEIEQKQNPLNYPGYYYSQEDWRRYLYAYYRLVEHVDAQIGEVITALKDLGLYDNTMIIFTSDHGDGLGSHAWNQKTSLHEEVACIPFIVKSPNKKNESRYSKALISNGLDLLPTICDYAGARIPVGLKGKSLRPILDGKADKIHEAVFVETVFAEGDGLGTHGWSVRTENYKYTIYSMGKYREQLFDMLNDRNEMVNLAVENRMKDELDRCRRLLYQWAIDTKDQNAMTMMKDLCPEFKMGKREKENGGEVTENGKIIRL